MAFGVTFKRYEKKFLLISEQFLILKEEVDKIALVAPDATISIIRDYQVIDKKQVEVPQEIEGVITCPNPNCITNTKEPVPTRFTAHTRGFRCRYCDTVISRERDLGNYI